MKQNVTRTFEAIPESLEPMRDLVTEACEKAGLDKKRTYGLCLAIDEIATNIIRHGYMENDSTGIIDMTIATGDAVTVTLQDDAVQYNPLTHQLPDEVDLSMSLEDRPIGGLGVLLAQKNVDEFNYEFADNRNQNIFIVKL